jgi:hypothetical protein
MKTGDLIIYTDHWRREHQALFVRWLGEGWAEIVNMNGDITQTASGYIKKGVLNEGWRLG